MGDGGGTGAGTYEIDAQSIAVNDTHVFGPRWLNELRFGWSAIDIGLVRFGYGQNVADAVGIPGINRDERTSGMATIAFTTQDVRAVGSGGGPGTANTSAFQVTDSLTHVRGRHTLKAGGSLILRKRNVYFSDIPLGLFAHNTNVTSNCAGKPPNCAPDPNTGFSFTSFMLGHPFVFNRSLLESPYTERRPEWSAYVQDDMRVSDRLTLNLGLRWDLFVPYVEDDDRQSNFDISTGTFVVASADARINGVKVGRYLQTYSKADFAPRLGFAYDVGGGGQTMLRGGFGKFWNAPLTGTGSSKGQNPPFLLSQLLASPSPFVPVLTLSSGVPPPTPQTGGNSRSSFDPDFRDGHTHQWSLNVQRQLGINYMVEIGYVGSRGRQLVVGVDVNQAPARLGVTDPNVNRPAYGVNGTLASVVQSQSRGTLDYHGLLTRFVRRYSQGFAVTTSYTFGKAIDLASDTEGFATFPNSYDLEYNRGPANYDVTHVFTATGIYTLPFARGRKLGGWQMSGLLLARSGYPFTVFQSQNSQSTITAAIPGMLYRPDRIASGRVDAPTIDRWFDTGAFRATSEPTAEFGDAGRNILRGPGQFTIDAALVKLTSFGPVETEVRLEAFNLLNHPVFGNPASTIGSGNAGTISSLMPFTPMRQLQLGLKVRF
jgi:TonB dependent receptor